MLSKQYPWLWKEIRLGKTGEASFDVSDNRHLMDPDQPCADCSSAAPEWASPTAQDSSWLYHGDTASVMAALHFHVEFILL